MADEVKNRIQGGLILAPFPHQVTVLEGNKEPADIRPFELYFVLQEFAMLKNHLNVMPQPPEKILELQTFHEWFVKVLQRWIIVGKAKALERVVSAVQLDKLALGDKIVRHSTSSIDVADVLYQMLEFWKLLSWPDMKTAANYEAQIIEACCTCAIHYADIIYKQLTDSGYFEHEGPFRTSDDLCVSVNNLEHVRRALSDFQFDKPDTHQEDQTDILLESTLNEMENRAEHIISKLESSMHVPLQKVVFHLAWSPESLPTNQAIVPLLEYLDIHLSALNSALLTKNFARALTLVWTTVLKELASQMDADADAEKTKNFYDRLREALVLLIEFFNAGGLGLAVDALKNEMHWNLNQRLEYHLQSTQTLIDMWYMRRLEEQLEATVPSPFGVLAVRVYFNHDSLCVEILHARDIIALDPNGFSDPFVIIELLPRRIFANSTEQQTNIHKVWRQFNSRLCCFVRFTDTAAQVFNLFLRFFLFWNFFFRRKH